MEMLVLPRRWQRAGALMLLSALCCLADDVEEGLEHRDVATLAELQNAISLGVHSIRLTQHLEVTTTDIGARSIGIWFPPSDRIKSTVAIWGDCAQVAPQPLPDAPSSTACYLTFVLPYNTGYREGLEALSSFDGSVSTLGGLTKWKAWLSNLVLVNSPDNLDINEERGIAWTGYQLWLTSVLIQGFDNHGLSTTDTSVYMTDVTLHGNAATSPVGSAAGGGAQVRLPNSHPSFALFNGCTFADNVAPRAPALSLHMPAAADALIIAEYNNFTPRPEPGSGVPAPVCVSSASPNPGADHSLYQAGSLPYQPCVEGGFLLESTVTSGSLSRLQTRSGLAPSSAHWLDTLAQYNVTGAVAVHKDYFGEAAAVAPGRAPAAAVISVDSGPALQQAVRDGFRWIRLTAHVQLDATRAGGSMSGPLAGIHLGSAPLGNPRRVAIWGECSAQGLPARAVAAAPSDTACSIAINPVAPANKGELSEPASLIRSSQDWQGWLENLVVTSPAGGSAGSGYRGVTWTDGTLVVDRVTFVGFNSHAILTNASSLLVSNSNFLDNVGPETISGGAIASRLADVPGAPALIAMSRCSFRDNAAAPGSADVAITYSATVPSDFVSVENTFSTAAASGTAEGDDPTVLLSTKPEYPSHKSVLLPEDELPFGGQSRTDLRPGAPLARLLRLGPCPYQIGNPEGPRETEPLSADGEIAVCSLDSLAPMLPADVLEEGTKEWLASLTQEGVPGAEKVFVSLFSKQPLVPAKPTSDSSMPLPLLIFVGVAVANTLLLALVIVLLRAKRRRHWPCRKPPSSTGSKGERRESLSVRRGKPVPNRNIPSDLPIFDTFAPPDFDTPPPMARAALAASAAATAAPAPASGAFATPSFDTYAPTFSTHEAAPSNASPQSSSPADGRALPQFGTFAPGTTLDAGPQFSTYDVQTGTFVLESDGRTHAQPPLTAQPAPSAAPGSKLPVFPTFAGSATQSVPQELSFGGQETRTSAGGSQPPEFGPTRSLSMHGIASAAVPRQFEGARERFLREMDKLDAQLDLLAQAERMHGYVWHGRAQRRRGGQGLVQFATEERSGKECAIKFYISHATFAHEKHVYDNPNISAVSPNMLQLYNGNTRKLADPEAAPLLSFIAFERGEALDEWAHRCSPDLITSIQVIWHVAACLLQLHKANIAHRDLKPSNTLWLPSSNQWTLIDIGCAAPLGTMAPVRFSLRYASPETIAAYEAGDGLMQSSAAVDAWSLGVMSWELLTGQQCFPPSISLTEMTDALMGRTPLPWEKLAPEQRNRLGIMRRPVLSLLERDPSKRPDMNFIVALLSDIFAGNLQGDAPDAEVNPSVSSAQLAPSMLPSSGLNYPKAQLPTNHTM